MRKAGRIAYLVLLVCLIVLLNACAPRTVGNNEDMSLYSFDWTKGALVPFSGYLCAYENTDIFLQIPMIYEKTESNTLNGLFSMELTNSAGENISCKMGDLSSEQVVGKYKMATFTFHTNFAKAGTYSFDKVIVNFNYKSYEYEIGTLFFDIIPKTNEDLIENSSIVVVKKNLEVIEVSYKNISDSDIEITGFSYYDAAVKAAPKFTLYTDRYLTEINPEGNVIPAGEKRAVYISQQQKTETRGDCFLYLPFVEYTANGKLYKMPAQFQATAVQPSFTDEELQEFMQSGTMREIPQRVFPLE